MTTLKNSTSLLLGIVVGAGAVLAAQRLLEILEEEDADALVGRLSRQLEELDARVAKTSDPAE